MKTLIFERAGMKLDDMNDAGTGRIRTAFHTKDGEGLFLEMIAVRRNKFTPWAAWERTGVVSHCYWMEEDKISADYKKYLQSTYLWHIEWTIENILKFVNSLGGDFDEVRIADPEVYRVFKNTDGNYCNFGD